MPKKDNLIIYLLLFLALSLRLSGITHGLPFIFHPDEPTLIQTAISIRYFPNPGHFDWPHLYIYLNAFLYFIFIKFRGVLELLGFKSFLSSYLAIMWEQPAIYYLLSRIFTAFISALTIIPVYLTAKKLFGERAGVFAALGLALLPFEVWHSHYALVDSPTAFFVAWSLYFAVDIIRHGETNDFVGSGFHSGLAASTKYHGGLSALNIPIAHFIRVIFNKEKLFTLKSLSNLVISGIAALIGFIIGTPYALLDFNTFSRTDSPKGAFWQFTNVGKTEWIEIAPKFLNEIIYKIPDDLGYSLLIGFFIALAIVIFRLIFKKTKEHDKYLWFLLITGLLLLFYISTFARSRSHYYIITYPYIAVTFGYTLSLIYDWTQKYIAKLSLFILAIIFFIPALHSFRNSYVFYRSDTRTSLYFWLKENLTPNQMIIYNNKNLHPVLEKLDNPKYKISTTNNNPSNVQSSLVILTFDDISRVREDEKPSFLSLFKEKIVFENNLRLGPDVIVFFNK